MYNFYQRAKNYTGSLEHKYKFCSNGSDVSWLKKCGCNVLFSIETRLTIE